MKKSQKEQLSVMAKTLKTIAHPEKLKILMMLGCRGALSVSEIRKSSGLTQSMTSQHLLAMKAQGVLKSIKEGNRVYYSIGNKSVLKVITCMKKCK